MSSPTDSSKTDTTEIQHNGVGCDLCNMVPILGIRYKCVVCENFDLCETCEHHGGHPDSHPRIKMRIPHSEPFRQYVYEQSNLIAGFLHEIEELDEQGDTEKKMMYMTALFDLLISDALGYVQSHPAIRRCVIEKCHEAITSSVNTFDVINRAQRLLATLDDSYSESFPPPPVLQRSDYRDPSRPLVCIPAPTAALSDYLEEKTLDEAEAEAEAEAQDE